MKKLIFIVLIILSAAVPAGADPIVNTGDPTGMRYFYSSGTGSGYASQFTVTQDWTVTDVSTWIHNHDAGQEEFRISVFSGADNLPSGDPLYSATFYGPSGTDSGWYGPTGLNWSLIADTTYWVAVFAVVEYPRAVPVDLGYHAPVVSALINEAVWNGTEWSDSGGAYDAQNFGWKVNGTAASVPEPATLLLLSLGLVGLAGFRKKMK